MISLTEATTAEFRVNINSEVKDKLVEIHKRILNIH